MTCSDHDLWTAFHTHTTDVLRVSRAALNAYFEETGLKLPGDLVVREPRTGSSTVEVRRSVLWYVLTGKLLVKHDWNIG